MDSEAKRRIIVALDFPHLNEAYRMAKKLARCVGMFKVGKQLFTAEGPNALRKLSALGPRIFLDLKYHDIPNTVACAVRAAVEHPGLALVNVHALGGRAMMQAAAKAMPRGSGRPKLLAVTILTSLDQRAMREVGIQGTPHDRAVRLARIAQECGVDGVVCSAHEVHSILRTCGPDFLTCVQGVRPAGTAVNDQKRVATPGDAIRAGATWIGVGRAVTQARNPAAAAAAIAAEIAQTLRGEN